MAPPKPLDPRVLLALGLAACKTTPCLSPVETDTDNEADADTDADSDADTDADTDADSDADSDTDTSAADSGSPLDSGLFDSGADSGGLFDSGGDSGGLFDSGDGTGVIPPDSGLFDTSVETGSETGISETGGTETDTPLDTALTPCLSLPIDTDTPAATGDTGTSSAQSASTGPDRRTLVRTLVEQGVLPADAAARLLSED